MNLKALKKLLIVSRTNFTNYRGLLIGSLCYPLSVTSDHLGDGAVEDSKALQAGTNTAIVL